MSSDDGQITLKIHGLDVDNDLVRADVFVAKLRALVDALKRMDRLEHGNKSRHQYIISDLQIGSALATIREKARSKRRLPSASSVAGLSELVSAIYDGDTLRAANFPKPLIQDIRRITGGSEKTFSHAEITFPRGLVIRVDDFLEERAREAEAVTNDNDALPPPEYFQGTAHGTFEGVLQELDARGTLLRGKLILSVGGVELDCVMNRDEIPAVREHFNQRVSVDAVAHYDGRQQLPVRLEIRNIHGLADHGDLTRWRGTLNLDIQDGMDEEW